MSKRGQRTPAGLKDQTHVRLSNNHLYLLRHHRSLSASLTVNHHKYKHKGTHSQLHMPTPHQGAREVSPVFGPFAETQEEF